MSRFRKRSDLSFSRKSNLKKEKSAVSSTPEQNVICSQFVGQHWVWADHYGICSQFFASHVVDSRPLKRKKNFHRIIKSVMPGSLATTASFRQWKLVIPQRAEMYWRHGTVSFDLCTSHISLFRSLPLPFLLLLFFFFTGRKTCTLEGLKWKN